MILSTAERLAGAAVALQLACWYLINLRTLKVRIDVNDLSSEYTEEAYTYYYFGCMVNLFAMVRIPTPNCLLPRSGFTPPCRLSSCS